MNEEKAIKILGTHVDKNNNLVWVFRENHEYMNWENDDPYITLDGDFDIEQLKAIVWWMGHKVVSQ